ncbi:MAG: sigma-70 family RNA polymerase sigma factor [Limisphaerales bacterium]
MNGNSAATNNLTKFNLDFPGGTPKELVAAIEKATGKPLNVIIPDDAADTKLPPLKMDNVDAAQLFDALEQASVKQQAYYDKSRGFGAYSTHTSAYAFKTSGMRVARHVKAFDAEEKFWSWLTVLARSALADESRKRRRYFAFLERFTRHNEIEGETEFEDDSAVDERLRVLLNGKMQSLPHDEQELLERKYILRQSVREIAGAQQTTEKAVESKYHACAKN